MTARSLLSLLLDGRVAVRENHTTVFVRFSTTFSRFCETDNLARQARDNQKGNLK
jgi:hypothetical protein